MIENSATLAGVNDDQSTNREFADYSNVEGFLEKVFRKERSNSVGLGKPSSSEIDEFERTSNLIESASQAIDALSTRCEILEAELVHERDVCTEQAGNIEILKNLSIELKAENAAYKAEAKAMNVRCQTAEKRLAELEQAQKMLDRRASKAETISTRLQQQVEAAFGQGSPIRSVMESVTIQLAAE